MKEDSIRFAPKWRVHRLVPILLLLCLASAGCATGRRSSDFDLGFIASRDTDLRGSRRLRMLGPFFERKTADNGATLTAVRPFFNARNNPQEDRSISEYLWPVGIVKRHHKEVYWRVLTAFGIDFDNTDPDSRWQLRVFPILFAGRDSKGAGYFAIFPIGGKINEFLGMDRIKFVLFPLYASSSRGRLKAHDILWPLISWTKGPGIWRYRIAPFYGKSVNGDDWTKRFVLWPLWSSARYNYPDSNGYGFILFPLFGFTKLSDQIGWSFLPPVFSFSHSRKHKELNSPWPFVQYASGSYEKLWLWPLWGTAAAEHGRTSFALWPVVSWSKTDRRGYVLRRLSVVPLIWYETKSASSPVSSSSRRIMSEPGPRREVIDRYFKLWPLMSYCREGEAAHFRMLDLWPTKRLDPVERNMAPFWTLYSHERVGDTREDELLWGLFRYRRNGKGLRKLSLFPLISTDRSIDRREWSFLLGLAGYKREGLRKTYRLLYFIKFSTGKKDAEQKSSVNGGIEP